MMMLGAVFERELAVAPRSRGLYFGRALYAGLLLAIIATCWLFVTATRPVETVGDAARFGATVLRILAPLQLALSAMAAAMLAAISVCAEKDRKTLEMLLMSDLTDRELVIGKLAGSLLQVVLLVLSAVPVFAVVSLFGGVTGAQLARLFAVTVAASLAAASLATAVAFWKDSTFQAIAGTLFLLAGWAAAGEVVRGLAGDQALGASPVRVAFEAISALPDATISVVRFLAISAGIVLLANAVAVVRMRRWNLVLEQARPVVAPSKMRPSRVVRGNPILWREVCTRAYGRMLPLVRIAWLLLFAVAMHGVWRETRLPRADAMNVALAIVPMVLASLLSVATLGVTSITAERDRGSFDLLLVSDLEPREIVFGKLFGALAVAREIVLLPLVSTLMLVAAGLASGEHAFYLAGGMAVLLFFCAVLGVHVGLSYQRSRTAIAVTLGTVAFLFVGVATAMRIMVAFGSSFELQLAPFLAVIVGGSVGLYACLAARVPSAAIGWAAALLPALTFIAITSFLQGQALQVFLVVVAAYGFSTAAMLVPAVGAFDAITGRSG